MKKALLILCASGCLLGCNQNNSGTTVDGRLKDEHIRHQLTAMIPSVSRHAPWPGAVQEVLANLDALTNVEGAKCSANQRNLLRTTTDNLRVVLADWEEYKTHAAHDSDPAEEKKANQALDDCMARLEKAKGALTEAAGTF
jgi:L-rhamnose isomerase